MKIECPRLVCSDKNGRLYIHAELEPVGMKAGLFFRLRPSDFIKIPPGSQIFTLPRRDSVGYDPINKTFVRLSHAAVGAFVSPGHTITHCASFIEKAGRMKPLPLFSYGAIAYYRNMLYTTAIRIDGDVRHDSRFIDMRKVKTNAKRLIKIFKGNRLIPHLEKCAIEYGCPNAQNLFLNRYEAPLPTSPACNALCPGCISYQPSARCKTSQPRIKFIPTPEEIAEIAIYHIKNVRDPIVSFGQGCEGEPLLTGDTLEKSIKLIREITSKGVININTNASMPDVIVRLIDVGLNSVRVSLNSVRRQYYRRYYKPKNYDFTDVMGSIEAAKRRGVFVSLNYLTMPGFTDSRDEFSALKALLEKEPIDMIQWRNLNYDPMLYFRELKTWPIDSSLIGIKEEICLLRKRFPHILMGYFNPFKNAQRIATNR